MLEELTGMAKTLEGFLSSVDPALLHATDAARALEAASAVEQRAASLKTLLAKRASESQVWANRGHRSPEAWLAQTTGTSYGQAAGTLEASEKLENLPTLEGAVRRAVGAQAQRAGRRGHPGQREEAAGGVEEPELQAAAPHLRE